MKKSKLLLVLVVSVLALTVGLTACNKKPSHSHTYSTDWTYDETYHWHAASCEHSSEVADKAEHTFGNWETVTAPTYTQKGSEKRECSICHYAETKDIAKLEQVESTFVLNTTTKEYDGTAVAFEKGTDYTVAEDYDGAVVIKFYSDEDATAEVTKVVNAGVYYVVATLAATDKYEAYTSAPIEFTVTQATYPKDEYSIIRGKSYPYNGREQPLGPMEILGSKDGEYTYCWEEDGEYTRLYPRKKDVGVYTAYYKFTPNDTNYKVVTGTVELTIRQATNEWTTEPTIEGWTYGDEPNAPVAEAKFGNADITYTYEVFVSRMWALVPSITSTTSAGQYRVTATIAETDNYTGLTSSAVTFEITQATNEWTTEPTIEGWTYGDEPNAPVAEAKFGNADITYTYEVFVSRMWAFVPSITSTTSVGTYRVTVAIAETDNYTLLTKTVTFSITKATNTWTKQPSIAEWMYGNEPSTPVGTARFGEVTFEYADTPSALMADANPPTEAGTYYLLAHVNPTDNYTGLDAEIEFTIQKRLIKAVKTSKEYDGNNQIYVGADGFELFNNAGTSGVISGDEVYMTFSMETADVGSKMENRTNLQGAAASNYDLPNYDMYILPQITPRTLNNFDIDGSPDETNSGAGAGQYAGKWYYEHTLETRDTTCLLTGDEVKVRIWFANENDMTDYMTASEISLVNSIDLIEEGTAFIEIYGGADGNNYQIGTTDLGIYVAGN